MRDLRRISRSERYLASQPREASVRRGLAVGSLNLDALEYSLQYVRAS
jgi:hypothetical protein